MSDLRPILPAAKGLYTLPEAAEALHLHRVTLWRHVKAGRLRVTQVGRRVWFLRDDLEAMLLAGGSGGPPEGHDGAAPVDVGRGRGR